MSAIPDPSVLAVIGNPRPESRTHGLARTLAAEVARTLGGTVDAEVDLALLGPKVLDFEDPDASQAVTRVLAADVLVLASPTYKASYSGLLKAFVDRIGGGALAGAATIPVMLGGNAAHRLAIDVHFAAVLVELGGVVPGRGLFVLESELEAFPEQAAAWVQQRRELLQGAVAAHRAAAAG